MSKHEELKRRLREPSADQRARSAAGAIEALEAKVAELEGQLEAATANEEDALRYVAEARADSEQARTQFHAALELASVPEHAQDKEWQRNYSSLCDAAREQEKA